MAAGKTPLFVLPNLNAGGAERTALELLGDLSARGFKPIVFTLKREGEFLDQVPRGVRHEWGLESHQNISLNSVGLMRKLLVVARESDVIVGALEHEATYFAYLAATIAHRPVIGWVHTLMGETLRELAPIHRLIAGRIYPRLKKLVFPSQGAADSLARLMNLERARISVIPSHIDCEYLQRRASEPVPQWVAEVFRKPTVINVGRLMPVKGLDILIRAHARLRGAGVDHNLLIVGEGRLRRELEGLADRLGVRASVFMPGFTPNPHVLMKAAEVFAISSRFEGLPVVLIEALALGSAIVAADCPGGPREILEGGRYGLMVRAQNEVALADGISRLLGDRALRETLKAATPIRARDFSAEILVPQWERLLVEHG
jgi:glycosyltransferase involved in cell wall biosynthesis